MCRRREFDNEQQMGVSCDEVCVQLGRHSHYVLVSSTPYLIVIIILSHLCMCYKECRL